MTRKTKAKKHESGDWSASVRLTLPGHLTLDDRESLIEMVRGTAAPFPDGDTKTLAVQWQGYANEWDLRGAVEETLAELESNYSLPSLDITEHVRRWQGEAEPFA